MTRPAICLLIVLGSCTGAWAQQQPRQPARPAQNAPAQQQEAPQPPQPSEGQRPVRTETRTFDYWSVNCAEFENPKTTRCAATLQVVQQKTNQVIFAWTIAAGDDRKLVGSIVTPSGVLITPGIEMKLGKANVRRVGFTSCAPNQCVGTVAIDDAIAREGAQAETAEATVRSLDGRAVTFTFPMKGMDRAVAQLRQ